VAQLAELRERAGRPGRTEITLAAPVTDAAGIERCDRAGVDRVFVKPWRRTSDALESIGTFADEFLRR
jgi:hypothetical protein